MRYASHCCCVAAPSLVSEEAGLGNKEEGENVEHGQQNVEHGHVVFVE
jgi:hypothetical protein